jgi:hypothetical protein
MNSFLYTLSLINIRAMTAMLTAAVATTKKQREGGEKYM